MYDAHRPGHAPIYVVQVLGGQEDHAKDLVEGIVSPESYEELFLPRYEKLVRRRGRWRKTQALLVPGYLYLSTWDIQRSYDSLRRVPTLTKVLADKVRFVPLVRDETAWIDQLTSPGRRTVGMSCGVMEGDRVQVMDGPLMGLESHIAKIDRHKRLAWVQFNVMGRQKLVKLGLEVVRRT